MCWIFFSNTEKAKLVTKRRLRERTTFSTKQLSLFEELYKITQYPDVHQRKELAAKVNLAESKIQIWFKNRRTKDRDSVVGNKSSSVAFQSKPLKMNTVQNGEGQTENVPNHAIVLEEALGTSGSDVPLDPCVNSYGYQSNQRSSSNELMQPMYHDIVEPCHVSEDYINSVMDQVDTALRSLPRNEWGF